MNKKENSENDPVCAVKLQPRSSMNAIVGFEGDVLKIKVKSAPVDGLANRDLVQLLARHLKVAKKRIEIVSGHRSRQKTIKFHGLARKELFELLKS